MSGSTIGQYFTIYIGQTEFSINILMNGHCSKDILTSIVYTYNHGKYFHINILFVSGVCMFDGIAICFFLIYFCLTFWYKCQKIFWSPSFFIFDYISRTRTGYHFAPSSTRLLYLHFIWNPTNSLPLWPSGYRVGLRSDGRGFDSHHRRSFYFSVSDIF